MLSYARQKVACNGNDNEKKKGIDGKHYSKNEIRSSKGSHITEMNLKLLNELLICSTKNYMPTALPRRATAVVRFFSLVIGSLSTCTRL